MEADARTARYRLRTDLSTPEVPILCIGFCLGGRVSFLTNSILSVKAVVSFYGAGSRRTP